jgi:hypothetical protein
MKQLITLFLFIFLSFYTIAQIGLPIQQSFLSKNSLVVNYDLSKSSSFTRGGSTVTNIAGTASGNASIVNSPIFINSLGYVSLNGTNQYVVTPNLRTYFKSLDASIQKSFTMSFWVYPTAASGDLIYELDSQTPNSGWNASNIELVNGYVKYRTWNGSHLGPQVTSSTTVNLNQWHHVAMVYDGTSLKGYLNGVLQGTQTYARVIPTNGQFYAIGAGGDQNMGTTAYGSFNLAQFKLYQLPFSDSDILQEYNLRKDEFDYTIHSPSTNSNPTFWSISSAWNNSTGSTGASDAFGVYHFTPWLNSSLGWAAQTLDANQYITLNYDEPAYIKGVLIQPRANSGNQFVTKAHVETSMTGAAPWTRVVSDIPISTNITDDARVLFPSSVFAKSVRVIPVTWTNHITMRLGLLVKPNNPITTSNLVLHYNPANLKSYNGSGTVLNDLTANAINGTMRNVTFSSNTLNFNGSNSDVNITDNALLEPGSGSCSIEVWFNNAGTSGTVIGKYVNGGRSQDISYALRLRGLSSIRADFGNGSTAQITDDYTFATNTWVQMVYVWDKTNNNIYTYSNGILRQTKAITLSGSIFNSTTNLYLGSYNGGEFAQYFNGNLGIVRIYNKALSGLEVLQNFNSSKFLYNVVEFKSVGSTTWTVPDGVTSIEYLVVGGGGGGANGYDNAGGGGGGGGMVLTGELAVTPGSALNIRVGDGGVGGANNRLNNSGTAGDNSIFHTITALGGGGGFGSRTSASSGASQNGSNSAPVGGGGSQGGNGGKGGGGSTGSGSSNSGTIGGAGGSGFTSIISGLSIEYGTGGAGANSGVQNAGVDGTVNRGNGGRAGGAAAASSTGGGKGGSGIVILKLKY